MCGAPSAHHHPFTGEITSALTGAAATHVAPAAVAALSLSPLPFAHSSTRCYCSCFPPLQEFRGPMQTFRDVNSFRRMRCSPEFADVLPCLVRPCSNSGRSYKELESVLDRFMSHGLSDHQSYSAELEDTVLSKLMRLGKILEQLKRYGASGVLSYGLLNTAYYLTTFLLVWFYFAPAPGKMGYLAAVSRFLKVMAMVWAGSQVTKLLRAAGALALAPLVDRGLSWFTVRYKFESRGKAFFTIVALCLSLAIIVFLAVTLLWA